MKLPIRKIDKSLLIALIFINFTIVALFWYNFVIIDPTRSRPQYGLHRQKSIPVIVGRFVEPNSRDSFYNLTNELLNENSFDPKSKAGQDGKPVFIPFQQSPRMHQLFQINRFNLMASDQIPLNRSLPDVRKPSCKRRYDMHVDSLPNTSVIIVFHNEAWSTLLRTVWSVINRSPTQLIHEIILVDDASTRTFLKEPLDTYTRTLPVRTKILRSPHRIGLVKARLKGAHEAQAEVLTFLDAHCECTTGWLESLLVTLAHNRTKVVSPIIDIISDETFAYVKSFELHSGALNWRLHYRWFTLDLATIMRRKRNLIEPFPTPIMAGGLFSIDKQYFFQMGAYDDHMMIWGGENLEMSLRIWQCGGSIEIVPCSHVGHVFRKSSPYDFAGNKVSDTLYENLARVALVWLDDWTNFYFKFNPEAAKFRTQTNVTNRLRLKQHLKCKNFRWFLNTVWPQHFFPTNDRFFGRIVNLSRHKCLFRPFSKDSTNQPMGRAMLTQCSINMTNALNEMFVVTEDGIVMTDESICLDAPEEFQDFADVYILSCSGYQRQKWRFKRKEKRIEHVSSNHCLDVTGKDELILHKCSKAQTQQWSLQKVPWK